MVLVPSWPAVLSSTARDAGGAIRANGQATQPARISKRVGSPCQPRSQPLLIRGFGVRVPGGAPVLNWNFITPGLLLLICVGPR
jgi:hypothetical protein